MAQKEAEARAERLREALDKARHQDRSVSGSQDSSVGALGGTAPLILVGLDGSSTSWDAFSWAAGEATRSNGSLVAVYITPTFDPVALYGEASGYAAVEQLQPSDQQDPFILVLLAESYERLGRVADARAHYGQALRSTSHAVNNAFARRIARQQLVSAR